MYLTIGIAWANSIRDWFLTERDWKTAYPFAAMFWLPVLVGRITLWVYWTITAAIRRSIR